MKRRGDLPGQQEKLLNINTGGFFPHLILSDILWVVHRLHILSFCFGLFSDSGLQKGHDKSFTPKYYGASSA